MGRSIWIVLLILQVHSAMVYGCSCVDYPSPLCNNYESTSNIYAARVINATCSCIPANSHDTNSDYSYNANTTNVSCVSAALDSGQVVSETVVRTTCDVYGSYYGLLPCKNILTDFVDCPYGGQVFMDCVPLCPTTCSNMGVASPCPSVCVKGCGCPDGMVINEEQRRCVMPSQCPNKACPLDDQVITCSCHPDCLRPYNDSCAAELCDVCACPPPTIADYITGKCVQPEQCTACPIEGQVFTECGSSCPLTCDNVNDTISCDASCWQGCECPSGMVIDVERRRCVEASQCTTTSMSELPAIIQRTSEDGQYGCIPRYVCPHNEDEDNDYNPCQYTVEVTRVFKGSLEVGDVITEFGPDLLTSCGNPRNILSVDTTYVVGVGGPCSVYNAWTAYNHFSSDDLELLANNCSGAITPLPGVAILILLTLVSYFGKI